MEKKCSHRILEVKEFQVLLIKAALLDFLSGRNRTEFKVAFVGDVLFAMGCGRVIEDSMEAMWNSIEKVAKLPPETMLYCGHEYTIANVKFALTVEPGNAALQARAKEMEALRAQDKPTLPTKLADELATNPFIRADSAEIRSVIGMENASNAEVFAEVRERKNRG